MFENILYPIRRLHGRVHSAVFEYKRKKAIKKYKNIHQGKRCFIIGNGPSLRAEDLNKLKNEICFASHRIHLIFNQTDWRPMYYCAQDQELIKSIYENINTLDIKGKFIGYVNPQNDLGVKNDVKIKLILKNFYPDLPSFSENVEDGTYEGFTVTYMCLQIAAYMGFSEIYLLGVDHSYSSVIDEKGNIKKNNTIKDHFSEQDVITNVPQLHKSNLAYLAAKEYAEKNNIKIFNATRGGNLDIYERIDFDHIKF